MTAKGYEALGVGKRKTSVARVYLKAGEGKIIVNGKSFEDYFGRATLRMVVKQPLVLLDKLTSFDIKINVKGGGKSGQAGACRHGISRALLQVSDENRAILKPAKYLTRDDRKVERKKYGRHKARKKPQFSKR